MLSERKTSAKKTKVFSINHQTHEKLSSITKLFLYNIIQIKINKKF